MKFIYALRFPNIIDVITDKIFSYLNADELEKLRAEEERKIASLTATEIGSINELDHSDGESIESQRSR